MNNKDIYDIIIENEINDWKRKNFMDNQNQREIWEVPKYSKSEINKAGKIIASVNFDSLRNINITLGDIDDAIDILNN